MATTVSDIVGNHGEPWEWCPRDYPKIKSVYGPLVPSVDYPRAVACVNAMASCKRPEKLRDVLVICDRLCDEPTEVAALVTNLRAVLAELRGQQ